MLPLVVGSHPDSPWIGWWVHNLPDDRPVLINHDGGYEPAALLIGMQHFDRFLFLQDSTRILSVDFWTTIDQLENPTWLTGWPPMYMAVHDTRQLEPHRLRLEQCTTKQDSIRLEADLPSLVDYETLWPHIKDANAVRREHVNGRNNLVLGNDLFEKYKGTWQ